MRILVLNHYFHPDASTGLLLAELCEDLSKNHEVWVITGRPSYNVPNEGELRGLIVRQRMGSVRILRVWSTSFDRVRMAERVANYLTFLVTCVIGAISVPKPDVVVTCTNPPPVVVIGALLGRLWRVPYVLSSQDIYPEAAVAAGEIRNSVLASLLRAAGRVGRRRADRIVAIGDDMRRRLVTLGVPARKIVVIRNWADGKVIHPVSGANLFRGKRGWEGKFVVMHSGNLGMGQDINALIEAAVLLRDEPDLVFAIVGEGMLKLVWEEKVRNLRLSNVEFIPFQPRAQLANSLGAANVHVVVHRRGMEGFQVPSKLYGILAAGKPCIAAVAEGSEVARTVEEAGCGIVVEPDDPGAIAAAILELRTVSLAVLGAKARAFFDERHDRRSSTNEYRWLLESLAGD